MGPDGHTCSLFPNHPLLNEKSLLIAPINDSPKPPPERVTMTYPLINNAKTCIFPICGKGKSEMVKVHCKILSSVFCEIVIYFIDIILIYHCRYFLFCVQRILKNKESLPAGLVQPAGSGKVIWLLDEDAASSLEN